MVVIRPVEELIFHWSAEGTTSKGWGEVLQHNVIYFVHHPFSLEELLLLSLTEFDFGTLCYRSKSLLSDSRPYLAQSLLASVFSSNRFLKGDWFLMWYNRINLIEVEVEKKLPSNVFDFNT